METPVIHPLHQFFEPRVSSLSASQTSKRMKNSDAASGPAPVRHVPVVWVPSSLHICVPGLNVLVRQRVPEIEGH
jgi:hypothetical protein